jgi:thiol-disulfide isomerase/thioredoxin
MSPANPPKKSPQPKRPASRKAAPSRTNLYLVGALVAVLLVLVGIRFLSTPAAPTALDGQTAPATLVSQLVQAGHNPAGYSVAGGGTAPYTIAASTPTLKLSGKPAVVFVGAEFCPYCAALRWSLIIALSRFGTFSGLTYMTSSTTDVYPDTHTFSFAKSRYTSPYLTFLSDEIEGNVANASGQYPLIQPPTQLEAQLLSQYDAAPYVQATTSGGVPFVDVANRFIWGGSVYDPGLLAGLTWAQIAQQLASPGSTQISVAVMSNANLFTAGICKADGQQPGSVCQLPGITQLEATLPPAGQ